MCDYLFYSMKTLFTNGRLTGCQTKTYRWVSLGHTNRKRIIANLWTFLEVQLYWSESEKFLWSLGRLSTNISPGKPSIHSKRRRFLLSSNINAPYIYNTYSKEKDTRQHVLLSWIYPRGKRKFLSSLLQKSDPSSDIGFASSEWEWTYAKRLNGNCTDLLIKCSCAPSISIHCFI